MQVSQEHSDSGERCDVPLKYVLPDNDVRYPKAFDEVLQGSGAEIIRNIPRSPTLPAHVGRFIKTHQCRRH